MKSEDAIMKDALLDGAHHTPYTCWGWEEAFGALDTRTTSPWTLSTPSLTGHLARLGLTA
eukprot:5177916-Amphidinium_carterae.1